MGEDVGHYGGSYKVSFDLYKKYGEMRLLDTPICENAFLGMGIGAAMTGLRPIIEGMNMGTSFSLSLSLCVCVCAHSCTRIYMHMRHRRSVNVGWNRTITDTDTHRIQSAAIGNISTVMKAFE